MRARWAKLDRRLRYLLVGGWNSAVAYGTFAVAWFVLSSRLPPSLIVVIAYLLASLNGYVAFRSLVFGPARHPLKEYVRYQMVYVPIVGLNAAALPLGLALTSVSPYALQLVFSIVAIVLAYLGNRLFVFRGGS